MHQVFPSKESNKRTNEYLNIYIYIYRNYKFIKDWEKRDGYEEMANKSTTFPIKLAVNCARLESIRKITQRRAIVSCFSLLAIFHEIYRGSIAYERRRIDPSLRTPLDSTNRHSSLRARKERSARFVAFLWTETREKSWKKRRNK